MAQVGSPSQLDLHGLRIEYFRTWRGDGSKEIAWFDRRKAQYAARYIPSLIFLTAGSHQNSPNRGETPLPHGSLH
jgi:hypothetical protein